MEYDSDSELHATDTLRFDTDSEDESKPPDHRNTVSDSSDVGKKAPDDGELPQHSLKLTEDDSDHEDSSSETAVLAAKHTRKAKVSTIIDSDTDDDQEPSLTNKESFSEDARLAAANRLKSLLDSDSDSDSNEKIIKQKKKVKKHAAKNDSDAKGTLSESDDDPPLDNKADVKPTKRNQKKIKASKEASTAVKSARDILASLNLFFDDDDDDKESTKPDVCDPDNSSQDESNEELLTESRSYRKITAKQAMENRQIIQSESQRMARETYIDVPYHRTKAYSFEEFLARKTIYKPDPKRDCVGKSTSSRMSIRMTAEELEEFSRQLTERELESQEFFKSEDETSECELENAANASAETQENPNPNPTGLTSHDSNGEDHLEAKDVPETTPTASCVDPPGEIPIASAGEEQNESVNEIDPQPSNDVEALPAAEASLKETCAANDINYDLIPQTPSMSTVSAKKAAMLLKLNLPQSPRLSGNLDMVIDLDSGTLQPKEPSGADILFQRLAKCNPRSTQKASSAAKSVSILSTENGVVKMNTVSLFADEDRPLVAKEPTPGAAFFKLKQALKEKIDNNRRESMRKREAEFIKKIEIEKAELGGATDDEEEELLEDECDESEEEEDADAAGQQKSLLNDEAMEEQTDEAMEEQTDEAMDDTDEDEDADSVQSDSGEDDPSQEKSKKQGRIIKAFEDSDDESSPGKLTLNHSHPSHETPGNVHRLDDKIHSDNEENEENVVKLCQDKDMKRCEAADDDELMALCSGQFATQQPAGNAESQDDLVDAVNENHMNREILYTQTEGPIGESQLMDLCSGRFETQTALVDGDVANEVSKQPPTADELTTLVDDSENSVGGKLRLDSSDDETEPRKDESSKSRKKRKRKQLAISDDEDEEDQDLASEHAEDQSDADERDDVDESEDEPEEGERYVDYDSEENEIPIQMTKAEKKKMLANFVENEAELSESEWGSADEDEKDLDRYDVDVADEEQYDQKQLQRELEKIHHRQMLDQDNRELEHLKEVFLEDEEKDGVGRVRQFRWKNVEKTFSLDYDKQNGETEEGNGEGSDDETELQWRKLRHERNLLLKEKNIDPADFTSTAALNSTDATVVTEDEENTESAPKTPIILGKKKITVVKKAGAATSSSSAKEENPFLISSSTAVQGHKGSFLSRDADTLNKLANLVKSNPETEGSGKVLGAKARNFVFAALSPAVEKSNKRSLDPEDVQENTNTKKAKTAGKESGPRKKMLLDSIM